MSELVVLLGGQQAGTVRQLPTGRLEFSYDKSWQWRSESYPLSLSLPLTRAIHDDEAIRSFMEGLLPDNPAVLDRWARSFHVSPRNAFALLSHMGEDCAGAVQFVPEHRLPALSQKQGGFEPLGEVEIAARLHELVSRHGTGRLAGDIGNFSLAGAQPKMALHLDGDTWGIPSGAVPTTHILKPSAQQDLDGFEINEHFCLTLARELGLAAASSRIVSFGDQPAIVLARYDRAYVGQGTIRLHQEDLCQALCVPPRIKYQSEGGPGAPPIMRLLEEHSAEPDVDAGAFVDALALNWLIAGTDAQAKNYSLLIQPDSVRLAPLYDLISVLPYPDSFPLEEQRLAMSVGREYRLTRITLRHWERLANMCDLDNGSLVERVTALSAEIETAARRAASSVRREGLSHPVLARLEESIAERAAEASKLLA